MTLGTRDDLAWETFEHGADIGVRGFGPTREAAFEQAALALTGVVTEPERVRPAERVELACEAPDDELLLYAWLNAVVYEMATRGMLFGSYDVLVHRRGHALRLTGRGYGERVDAERHAPAVEVKGATLTQLEVAREEHGGWRAQCVVDV
jgi:tRNA nucleotidyltransferase (CCA-adding enzyme)